jgi:hypothetical protein
MRSEGTSRRFDQVAAAGRVSQMQRAAVWLVARCDCTATVPGSADAYLDLAGLCAADLVITPRRLWTRFDEKGGSWTEEHD